jgi:hypothetical protein
VSVHEFWKLCPFELRLITKARAENIEAEWWRLATHASWLMNVWISKGSRVTAAKLLGKQSKSIADFSSIEEAQAYFAGQAAGASG